MQLLLSSPVRPSTKSDSFAWTVGLSKSAKKAKALDRAIQVPRSMSLVLQADCGAEYVYPSFK